ncbi:hypothetical protein ACFSX9_01660 [Flavobacterium ardleyense]|uniref:Uncharacterized protein n=1 Tax=Flavobacterium ardleyense TaxID=2038737 RepID=A0ABW5Z5L5_9FLAO
MKTKTQIVLLILIVCLVSFVAYYNKYKLEKNGIFVIGKVVKNTHGTGNDGFFFKFHYKNTEYDGWCFTNSEGNIGKSYFCIINPKNINKSVLLVDYPVPDSISKSPYNGWKKIPVLDYQVKVDEYLKTNIKRVIDNVKPDGADISPQR